MLRDGAGRAQCKQLFTLLITMWINSLIEQTGVDLLQRVAAFTEARHQVLADNIANIDTPGYKMRDLSLGDFQQDLLKALQSRRGQAGQRKCLPSFPLPKVDSQQYLLFQDGNNRSIEKQVSALASNGLLHNVAVELLRSRYNLLQQAIQLRF